MSRIQPTFEKLAREGRKALIPYITAGFPYADITPELMHAMVAAGCDVIELGVPFSDPMADGPVIQKAGEKALALGIGLVQVLQSGKPVLTWRSATAIDRIPIWSPGSYEVRVAARRVGTVQAVRRA